MPVEVISNTSPILSLQGIGQLDLLHKLYGKIHIPNAVYQEVENGKNKEVYVDLAAVDWIVIEAIQSKAAYSSVKGLGLGETEAIILCMERNAKLIILDDKSARSCALRLNLPVIGTMGVLLAAKRDGLISAVKPLLEKMQLISAWLKPQLVHKTIVLAGEV
jgi:predicted nucleic acid-binding protein